MHLDPMLPTVVAVLFAVLVISVILKRFNQSHVVAYLVLAELDIVIVYRRLSSI